MADQLEEPFRRATESRRRVLDLFLRRRTIVLVTVVALALLCYAPYLGRSHPADFVGTWGIPYSDSPRIVEGLKLNADGTGARYAARFVPGPLYFRGPIRWWVKNGTLSIQATGQGFTEYLSMIADSVWRALTNRPTLEPLTMTSAILHVSQSPDRRIRLRYQGQEPFELRPVNADRVELIGQESDFSVFRTAP